MLLKVVGKGFLFNEGAYLRDPWNMMDFFIIFAGYFSILGNSNVNI